MTEGDKHPALFEAIRDMELDKAALRRKLARHEFRQLERELKAPRPFEMTIGASSAPPEAQWPLDAVPDASLPPLPVPLGSIFAEDAPGDLPALGVYDEGLTGARLANALMGLMTTHYQSPFARLVFVMSHFEALPLLGRYGFACENIGHTSVEAALARLKARYGIGQILALSSGTVLAEWSDR